MMSQRKRIDHMTEYGEAKRIIIVSIADCFILESLNGENIREDASRNS